MRAFICLVLGGAIGACGLSEPDGFEARKKYNEAILLLQKQDFEAAQKKFLSARDEAGADAELRFSAAYNLGLSFTEDAQSKPDDAETALSLLRQAAAWFRDAVRLSPDNEDARVNLELVLKRTQLLVDKLNHGKNGLAPRLDRLIEAQRDAVDRQRKLMTLLFREPDPATFREDFFRLATQARTLLSDAGVILDLARDEIHLIENKADEEKKKEDESRLIQLKNLEFYLNAGRNSESDARRALRALSDVDGHRFSTKALTEFKRAREQLHDPVVVLKGILQDQNALRAHTGILAAVHGRSVALKETATSTQVPAWLTPDRLKERENAVLGRTHEILARLKAGIEQIETSTQALAPEQDHLKDAVKIASLEVDSAVKNMQGAVDAFAGVLLDEALKEETESLVHLAGAIEAFGDVRSVIELIAGSHEQVLALVKNPDAAAEGMSAEDKSSFVRETTTKNLTRLERLKTLLTLEGEKAKEQAGQAPEGEKAVQNEAARYEEAERLRGVAVSKLSAFMVTDKPVLAAEAAKESIQALRRLFFSLVEHLKDLLRQSSELHDETASMAGVSPEDLGLNWPRLGDEHQRHTALGDALATAFEQQADTAAQSQDPKAQAQSEKLGEAAQEVRSGALTQASVVDLMAEVSQALGVSSVDIEPTLESQKTAIGHFEKALSILSPPPPQQDPKDGQQDQSQGSQGAQKQEVSKGQAERRLSAIRERENERARRRNKQNRTAPEPVEKDW